MLECGANIYVFLLDVLRHIHREVPAMSLEFRIPSESVAAELEAGEVDFIVNPGSQNSSVQSGAVLFEDSYIVMVDADNREIGDSISIDQYLAQRHVAFRSGKFGLPPFETWIATWNSARIHDDSGQLLEEVNFPRLASDLPANGGVTPPVLHRILSAKTLQAGVNVRLGLTV